MNVSEKPISNVSELLDNVKNGIPLSFESVYTLYLPLIDSMTENYRRRFDLTDAECEDLRQEATIALYNAALSYKNDRGVSFGLYAKICIKNRIVSCIRRRNGTSVRTESIENSDADIPDSSDFSPEKLIISKESMTDLRKRISLSLTELESSVFDLCLSAVSYDDMASALGIPKKSIDNAMQRIKAKLRKLL